MSNNLKYALIALVVGGLAFYAWKKYKLVKKVAA